MLEDPAVSWADASRISVMSSLGERLGNIIRKRYDAEFKKLNADFLILRQSVFILHRVQT